MRVKRRRGPGRPWRLWLADRPLGRGVLVAGVLVVIAAGAGAGTLSAYRADGKTVNNRVENGDNLDGCGSSAGLGPSLGARLSCPGRPAPTTTPGTATPSTATPGANGTGTHGTGTEGTGTEGTGATAPGPTPRTAGASGGPGQTSVPVPNDWGYASCPSGAGANVVLAVNQYGQNGRLTGSKSVICPAGQSTTTLAPPPPPSAGQVWSEVPLPAPVPDINPATAGITQLASWFWVKGGGGPVSVTAEMGASTVTATASPVAYQWDFGDGTSAASGRAGGEGAPSVTHTYVEKGTYSVGLAVEYAGSYSFAGPAGSGSASLGSYWQAPVSASYTVQEVRSVLLPPGGAQR